MIAGLFISISFGIGLVVCIVILLNRISRIEPARFAGRFPPISDAEFMARCRPGITPQVVLRVRRIVAGQLGVEYDRIYPCTSFREDLGAD
jgi:hypothetical protein